MNSTEIGKTSSGDNNKTLLRDIKENLNGELYNVYSLEGQVLQRYELSF